MHAWSSHRPPQWYAELLPTASPFPRAYPPLFPLALPKYNLQQVIDEADRLLAQSFQDWLAQVLAATRPPPISDAPSTPISPDGLDIPRTDALAPAFLHTLRGVPYVRTDIDEMRESSCQKLLFSATLTRDPALIAALNLRDPKYFVVQAQRVEREGVLDFVMEKFSMPATLTVSLLVRQRYRPD